MKLKTFRFIASDSALNVGRNADALDSLVRRFIASDSALNVGQVGGTAWSNQAVSSPLIRL